MPDFHIGEILEIRADQAIPARFVSIENPVNIGIEPPPGGCLIQKVMYVGEAAEAVAAALRWERNIERALCAKIAEDYLGCAAGENAGGLTVGQVIAGRIRARG